MARLFVPPEELGASLAVLGEEAHRYLTRALRLGVGAAVTVFDGTGTEIAAVIERIEPRAVALRLGTRRSAAPVGKPVVLLQGIMKGERMDWLVEKVTELGVTRICPILTERSVVKPERGEGRVRRWRTIAQAAAGQCGRADLPAIDEPRALREAVAVAAAARFVVWERFRERAGALPLARALAQPVESVALLVGAEGGLTDAEVELAEAAGFHPVGLGTRILRSETAGVVAVALAAAAAGALD